MLESGADRPEAWNTGCWPICGVTRLADLAFTRMVRERVRTCVMRTTLSPKSCATAMTYPTE